MSEAVLNEGPNYIKNIANEILLNVDINEVLQVCMDYVAKKKTKEDIEKEYGPKIKAAVFAYAEGFARENITRFIREKLNDSDNEELNKLGNNDYANKLFDIGENACREIRNFYNNEIELTELFRRIGNDDFKSVAYAFVQANGVDVNKIREELEELKNVPIPAASFACLMESYNIYMKCLNDASIQHEERIRIQERCDASIREIRKYREEMEKNIAQYFDKNYDAIESGLMKMNEAILLNDSDGYIAGNVELQELFNYKPQFRNQKEFNDLMDSDESFKL